MDSLREMHQWTTHELEQTTTSLFGLVIQLDALIAANPYYVTPDFYEAARFLECLQVTLRNFYEAKPKLLPGDLVEINEHLLSIRWPIYEFLVDPNVMDKRRMFHKPKRDEAMPRYRGNGGIWLRLVELALELGDEILISESEIDVALRDWKRCVYFRVCGMGLKANDEVGGQLRPRARSRHLILSTLISSIVYGVSSS